MIEGFSDWDAERKAQWDLQRGNTIVQAGMALNNPGMKQFVLCLVNGQGKVEMFTSADPIFMIKAGTQLAHVGSNALDNMNMKAEPDDSLADLEDDD